MITLATIDATQAMANAASTGPPASRTVVRLTLRRTSTMPARTPGPTRKS